MFNVNSTINNTASESIQVIIAFYNILYINIL